MWPWEAFAQQTFFENGLGGCHQRGLSFLPLGSFGSKSCTAYLGFEQRVVLWCYVVDPRFAQHRDACVFTCVCVIPHAYSADSRWISVKVFYVSFTYFAVLNGTWMHHAGASWPNMFLDFDFKESPRCYVWCGDLVWCVCIVSCAMWGVQVLACVDGTPTNTFGISKDMILVHVRTIKTRILNNTECALDHLGMIWCTFFHCSFECSSGYESTTMCSRMWPAICHMRLWLEWLSWVKTNPRIKHLLLISLVV